MAICNVNALVAQDKITVNLDSEMHPSIVNRVFLTIKSSGNAWIDLNNNGIKDAGEELEKDISYAEYSPENNNFTIYGEVYDFDCSMEGDVKKITVKGHQTLKKLNCGNTGIEMMDLSDCTALEEFSVKEIPFSLLIMDNCPNLKKVHVFFNTIASLDFSGCPKVEEILCFYNQLTSIKLGNVQNLKTINISGNLLDETALNRLYEELPKVTSGEIHIGNNPGAENSNVSIAKNKGWTVVLEE